MPHPPLSRAPLRAFVLAQAFIAGVARGQTADYTRYVDTFHGTENGGNVFPGVVPAPFSVVKLGIDIANGNTDAYSGYLPNGKATGFSMMHESGTGGAPKYGVVSQLPAVGTVANPLLDLSVGRAAGDQSQVGYYKASLANNVVVELAGTNHAGLYQYTFPAGQTASVVVDVSHVLPSFRGLGWQQSYVAGAIHVDSNGTYTGNGTYQGGWNLGVPWTINFCGKFDVAPTSSKVFIADGTGSTTTLRAYGGIDSASGPERLGSVFTFNTTSVSSRVGISFISTARACELLDTEIPASADLPSLVRASQDAWNTQVFSKVTTTETDNTRLAHLYTSLYGMHLIPSNRTGENPLWTSSEPYYDDIFTFWDLTRCATSLMHVLQPVAYEEQVRSLIDIWRHDGYLPDARSSNFNGRVQGGSNADNVLGDAYVKGVRGQVNWDDGFSAMVTDAEKTPAPNNDPSTRPDTSSTKEGRGALPDWISRGYITPAFSRAVSRAVEYSVNDFALSQVAKGLGRTDDAAKYLNRSRNWRNHWNPEATSLGFSGFVVPRAANGDFIAQDPLACAGCYWGDAYYEDSAWTYSFNAHHDAEHLVALSGGPARFVERLDKFFEGGVYSGNGGFNHTIFNPGNEPGFTTPYLYNFAGRQDRTVRALRTAATYFNPGRGGIPGNSDAGAMQTWILWNMFGLYPITGQTTFLLGSPWFKELRISLGEGKTLAVTANLGWAEQQAQGAFYVQSVRVNGQPWDKAWVNWDDVFARGGEIDFTLGATPQPNWATGELPPSPAS